jgi:uncharacterized alkaline shock family protein YloU
MSSEWQGTGRITVSPKAIAALAAYAAVRSYGVVGMASKNLVDGLAQALAPDPTYGVEIRVVEDQIMVDLFLIVEYGTRISTVATSVANTVKYQIEKVIGTTVGAVNVHIQDLRVSNPD